MYRSPVFVPQFSEAACELKNFIKVQLLNGEKVRSDGDVGWFDRDKSDGSY